MKVVVKNHDWSGKPSPRKGGDESSDSVEFQDGCSEPEGQTQKLAIDPAMLRGVVDGNYVEGLVLLANTQLPEGLPHVVGGRGQLILALERLA